jgi:hypothetical protein
MEQKKSFKAYAFDQLREYLIINDVTINSKEDFIEIYFKMKKEGYFYKADLNGELEQVRDAFTELSRAYDADKDIVEKDLIFGGSKRVMEKMAAKKAKR